MNILAEALSYIDEKYIDAAADYRPERHISRVKYAAIAACAILCTGAAVFSAVAVGKPSRRRPIEFTSPYTSSEADGDNVMGGVMPAVPIPFEGFDSDENRLFLVPCSERLDEIPEELVQIIPSEEYKNWVDSWGEEYRTVPDSVDDYANLYSFIHEFDPDENVVREAVDMSDEEIDLILSDDAAAVTEAFATEYAIVKGGKAYSPYWIYVHGIDDYEAAGLTPEELEHKLQYYASFRYSDSAREFFEKKLTEFIVPAGDGISLMYQDNTLIYNYELPLVMKEFAIVDIAADSSEILYLVDNDPESGDKNIYAAVYMWDQLINLSRDSEKSFEALEAFCSYAGRSDYYKSFTPVPRGTVVRLAWDGLYETAPDGEPRRLTWLSRLQFSDSDCVYSEAEMSDFAEKLNGHYLDCEEFEDFAFLNNPGPEVIGNGYELIGGTVAYKLVPDLSGKRDELIATLDTLDFEQSRKSYIYYYGSMNEGWDTGYRFSYLLDCYITPESMRAFQSLADYSYTPVWGTHNDYVNHADGRGHMTEKVTVYVLGDYELLCYDFPVEQENGDTLYAQLFKRNKCPYDDLDSDDFENLSDYYELLYRYARSSGYAYYQGEYYHCTPYHPSAEEIERFKAEGEYIGESVYKPSMPEEDMFEYAGPNAFKNSEFPALEGESDYDRLLRRLRENIESSKYTSPGDKLFDIGEFEYYDYQEDNSYDCFVGNLLPGVPLYRCGKYIMAIPDEPIYNGELEPIAARLYYCGDESMEMPEDEEISEYCEHLGKEFSEMDGKHFAISEKYNRKWELCEKVPSRAEINEFRYFGKRIDYGWYDLDNHREGYGTGWYFNIVNALPDDERQELVRCYICGDWLLLEFDEPKDGVYGRFYRLADQGAE